MTRSWIADVSTAAATRTREDADDVRLAMTIASHPSGHRVGDRVILEELPRGRSVRLSRNAPDFVRPGNQLGAPLHDPFVSRQPIEITASEDGGVRLVGLRAGERCDISRDDIARGAPLELAGRVVVLLHLDDPTVDASPESLGMVGDSVAMRRVRRAIERAAALTAPVLVRGETGTGKELVARAIHERSARRAAPFISVNLGAVSRELAAADLFGALRGAYTGAARDREGYFRAAHGGTLFLDEIGEASPEVQAMLLRVLETGELYPVGAEKPVKTDVRVIAATDADLEGHIRTRRFKSPLLHRLAGYELCLPPLRERRDDIGRLLYHFAHEELAALGELERWAPRDPYEAPWLPASLAAQLVCGTWPGNIRQLRNVTRQLAVASRGRAQAWLEPRVANELLGEPVVATAAPGCAPRRKVDEISQRELREALQACAWDLKATAARLHISRASLYNLIDRSDGLRTAGDLSREEIAACFAQHAGDLDAMAAQLQVSRRALGRRLRELGLAARHAQDNRR